MATSTRREFLLLAAGTSAACIVRGSDAPAPGRPATTVRSPAVGQSWRYSKYDYFTGELLDTRIDRVFEVGQSVQIVSRSETGVDKPISVPSWGEKWWRENMFPDTAPVGGPIEIHRPWGMVVVDSHWAEMQSFEKAIPIWPSELRPGWSRVVSTHYKTPGSDEAMPWQLTMNAHRWESVTVPAGTFRALRYDNFIDFRFSIFAARNAAQRIEHVWFAPEIGRWVKRESAGTFHEELKSEVQEGSYRWELLSWK